MYDYRKLRYTAEQYRSLQGLTLVPFGSFAVVNSVLGDFGVAGFAFSVALACVAVYATHAIGSWYLDHYGHQVPRRPRIIWYVGAVALFYGLQALELRLNSPVSTFGAVMTGFFIYVFAKQPSLRWYWGPAAAVLIGMTVLPLFTALTPAEIWGNVRGPGWVACGAALILCGILDHLTLRKLVSPEPQDMVHG
jgi:hypothetical protein